LSNNKNNNSLRIYNQNCLEIMRLIPDYSINLIFTDPPYALGSKIVIKENGKVDYKKATDFMNKWDMPTGEFWEKWFTEAHRILKYGGKILMFGMDRQLLLFKYYACLTGFEEHQSLYWFFILNFPKATDLANMIAKRDGAGTTGNTFPIKNKYQEYTPPLAKKYDRYKYSISPLKQTNETIMIFQKPYKTKSCLHDTLEYENGNEKCLCGALDIDGNRCGTETMKFRKASSLGNEKTMDGGKSNPNYNKKDENGRYPAQTFCDSSCAEVLDKQSGVKAGSGKIKYASEINRKGLTKDSPVFNTENSGIDTTKRTGIDNYADTGGCSKILHKCDYDKEDYDLYNYCPKVSKKERNQGLKNVKNNHPTVKPLKLITRILKLFKTPNDQIILDPFMGSGSTGIVAKKLNYNFIGIELNEDYFNIAKERIKNS